MALATAWTLIITSTAFADNAVTDGDTAVAGSQDLAMGNVCRDATTSADASLAISRQGNYGSTNVFKKGSTVTWSVTSATSGLSVTFPGGATGSIPADWDKADNNTLSPAVTARVHYAAPDSTGSFSGSISFRATGIHDDGTTLTRNDTLNVSATRVTCVTPDTTAPTNGSISINAGADWTNDRNVTLALSAEDAGNITKYRLAETQTDLATASDVAVTPTTNFSASDVSFTLSDSDGSAKAVWVRFFDAAGNSADASDTIGLDRTAPVISGSTGTYIAGTWTNQNVSVTFSCAEAGTVQSGIVTNTVNSGNTTLSSDGADQQVRSSGTCTDAAGNSAASITVSDIDIDKTAPTITDLGPTTQPNAAGWYKTAVTNTFEASDNLSGFASATNPYEFTQNSGTAEGSAVTIASGSVSDVAGNTNNGIVSADFDIDLSDPYNVAFLGGPAANSSHYFGSVPAAPTCTADDDISGVASCTVAGYSTAVGTHTLTATATDNAGRSATATREYTVLAWTTSGFYSPVNMTPAGGTRVWNTIKGGQTVPLKFELFAGNTELTDTSSIASFRTTQLNCTTEAGVEDAIEITTTGGTSLRYDATAGQFIQNWQTPKTSGKCYLATVTFLDGSSISAYFKTK